MCRPTCNSVVTWQSLLSVQSQIDRKMAAMTSSSGICMSVRIAASAHAEKVIFICTTVSSNRLPFLKNSQVYSIHSLWNCDLETPIKVSNMHAWINGIFSGETMAILLISLKFFCYSLLVNSQSNKSSNKYFTYVPSDFHLIQIIGFTKTYQLRLILLINMTYIHLQSKIYGVPCRIMAIF
jgi:hypothetical protein